MILYPAIDLYEQQVVRLRQGRFTEQTRYGTDPEEQARIFKEAGSSWLHVVDLEGAKKGSPCHLELLAKLAETGLSIQYGGGVRTEMDVELALEAGATRVMTGSMILKAPDGGKALFQTFGNALVPSLDVKDGRVAYGGWEKSTEHTAGHFLERLMDQGFRTFLVTSVERDGTGSGPDLELYKELLALRGDAEILAAGGIWSMEDLEKLDAASVPGAVIGKALYEGGLDFGKALGRWPHA
jgi:phosphoribosylformimino-5-aminoimidazole carboxamide ribotide isomerase